jgi:hypothetical protein
MEERPLERARLEIALGDRNSSSQLKSFARQQLGIREKPARKPNGRAVSLLRRAC